MVKRDEPQLAAAFVPRQPPGPDSHHCLQQAGAACESGSGVSDSQPFRNCSEFIASTTIPAGRHALRLSAPGSANQNRLEARTL